MESQNQIIIESIGMAPASSNAELEIFRATAEQTKK